MQFTVLSRFLEAFHAVRGSSHAVSRSFTRVNLLSPWLLGLKKTMTRDQRTELCSDGIVVKTVDLETGEVKVPQPQTHLWKPHMNVLSVLRHGGPKLKETQVYPAKFARSVFKFHLKFKACN